MKVDPSWVAGILEGEGCFSLFQRRDSKTLQCTIICEMTDEDVVRKLQKALGFGRVSYRAPRPSRKPSWVLAIQKQKEVFDTLLLVMPYLGERRLAKAKQMFNYLEPIVCK